MLLEILLTLLKEYILLQYKTIKGYNGSLEMIKTFDFN